MQLEVVTPDAKYFLAGTNSAAPLLNRTEAGPWKIQMVTYTDTLCGPEFGQGDLNFLRNSEYFGRRSWLRGSGQCFCCC